ncbi:MAG TPA: hypothetical protein VGA59_02190, partial [Ramlibacter sp.]
AATTRSMERSMGRPLVRLAVATPVAFALVVPLLMLLPDLLRGPLAEVSGDFGPFWLDNVREWRSAWQLVSPSFDPAAFWFVLPVVGTLVSAGRVTRHAGCRQLAWLAVAMFAALALLLSGWHVRALAFAHLFCALPIAWLLQKALTHPRGLITLRGILVYLALGPLTTLFLPVASRTATAQGAESCSIRAIAGDLGELQRAASGRLLIAAPLDAGPELLYRTPHAVLGVPYHRNIAGDTALIALLSSTDDAAAKDIATKHLVDLVLVCATGPEIPAYGAIARGALAVRLAGGAAPGWLMPVTLERSGNFRVYRVEESN